MGKRIVKKKLPTWFREDLTLGALVAVFPVIIVLVLIGRAARRIGRAAKRWWEWAGELENKRLENKRGDGKP